MVLFFDRRYKIPDSHVDDLKKYLDWIEKHAVSDSEERKIYRELLGKKKRIKKKK